MVFILTKLLRASSRDLTIAHGKIATKNPKNANGGPSYNVLYKYKEDLSKIGKLALKLPIS